MTLEGIESENMYKARVTADSTATAALTEEEVGIKASLALTSLKQYISPLNFALFKTAFCPQSVEDDIIIYIHLKKDSPLGLSEYELKNICVEFDKVTDDHLAHELHEKMNNFALKFDNISFFTSNTIGTSQPNLDIEINKQFTSLRGVLVLCIDKSRDSYDGKYDGFNVDEVFVNIDGVRNQLYPNGKPSYMTWGEAHKFFKKHCMYGQYNLFMTQGKFHQKYRCLLLDFQCVRDDDNLSGGGREVKNNIQMRCKTSGTTANSQIMIYTISDTRVDIVGRRFNQIMR